MTKKHGGFAQLAHRAPVKRHVEKFLYSKCATLPGRRGAGPSSMSRVLASIKRSGWPRAVIINDGFDSL